MALRHREGKQRKENTGSAMHHQREKQAPSEPHPASSLDISTIEVALEELSGDKTGGCSSSFSSSEQTWSLWKALCQPPIPLFTRNLWSSRSTKAAWVKPNKEATSASCLMFGVTLFFPPYLSFQSITSSFKSHFIQTRKPLHVLTVRNNKR